MGREDATARRVSEIREWVAGELGPHGPMLSDIRTLLAALAAAEAERDAARSALEEHRIAYTALAAERPAAEQRVTREHRAAIANIRDYAARLDAAETARDQAREHAADAMMAHGLAVESLRHVEAECKRDMAAAEAERDEQRKDTEAWYRQSQVLSAENDRLEQRATRLAALEAAAQAWAAVFTDAPAQEPWLSPWQALHAALTALPGEEA